ncbi:hypothetical protein HQ29_03370 [Porphyromonas canoris]|uniref:Threonine/homoserine/homoserine lactone efflux protein n=1 Tax=Porphyromonas canoris TaxID=36875 RepID=A0ABR4XJW1_9PORP|nr:MULTISPECIES: LysE family transporter [Porphyromonas]KGL52707.1 hypothetical protein HQ29_03370 [Porphyromonas canoris]KGN91687.1 hypothetical protein HQ43_06210 [Porphyromonas canoris]KGN95731.1 hypothetical protein HQ39_05735 [Porphyromonas sp. COT-108 OH2963]
MLATFVKGLIIGVIVSAPMGPVGVECIRRTLTKGRQSGLLTGLGATASDIFYAVVTLIGVSSFIFFIKQYSQELRFFGSIFIVAFAFYVMNSGSSIEEEGTSEEEDVPTEHPYWRDFTSGFFLTLPNILIVLLYVGLFAQFSFLTDVDTENLWPLLIGVAGIAVGAVLWWTLITGTITKAKQWFNIKSIRGINRSIGLILLCCGLIGALVGLADLM